MEQTLRNALSVLPAPVADKLTNWALGAVAALPNILFALVFLAFVWGVVRLANWLVPKTMRRAGLREALIDVTRMVMSVALWIFGLLVAATILFPSVSIGNIFAAAGVGGIAIAFAAKDSLENFFAGLMLLIREPFRRGDFIACEGIDGQVEAITIRETLVRQTDGQQVVAPNAVFFKNPVTVRTDKELRRTTIIAGVSYDTDVDEAREIIAEAVRKVDEVRDDVKDVQVFAREFADSSINFEVTWWTGSEPLDIRKSRDKVVAAVKRALDEANIEIPFPYRTLTFKEPLRTLAEGGQQQATPERTAAE